VNDCPRCKQSGGCERLERFSRPVREGSAFVEAAMCLRCGGLWLFEAGIPIAFPELLPSLETASREGSEQDIACVECQSPLRGFVVEGLALDTCSFCGGVWIDGGEITPLEEARTAIAKLGERVYEGGYRTQAKRGVETDAVECSGCGRVVRNRDVTPGADGPLCKVCSDAIANPIEPPVGLAGRIRRGLRDILFKPCDECGEHVCAHRAAKRAPDKLEE
jgi:Zn-finger nucleic acid-binding protein